MPTAGVIVPRVTDSFDPPLVDANDIAALCAVRVGEAPAMVVAYLKGFATRSAWVTEKAKCTCMQNYPQTPPH